MAVIGRAAHRVLYGVVHLPPLPGTPFHEPGTLAATIAEAVREVEVLREGGADGALLQTADRVYPVGDEADPARVAAVTVAAARALDVVGPGFDLGIQIMRHAVRASLAVAKIVGGTFVRADAIVGATLSTHGWVNADPASIMAYRRSVDAFDIDVIADIDSMHFTWPDSDVSTADVARRAMLVGADAVCIAEREEATLLRKVASVKEARPDTCVFLGGFVDHENAARCLLEADGAFVAGCLTDPDDPTRFVVERVRRLADIVHDGGG